MRIISIVLPLLLMISQAAYADQASVSKKVVEQYIEVPDVPTMLERYGKLEKGLSEIEDPERRSKALYLILYAAYYGGSLEGFEAAKRGNGPLKVSPFAGAMQSLGAGAQRFAVGYSQALRDTPSVPQKTSYTYRDAQGGLVGTVKED